MKKLLLILLCLPIIVFGQEKIDLKSESSIEKYLNSSIIDTIEGIWYFSLNGKTKKIAIIKDTYKYKSTIIDENSDENGFHFLNIIPTYSDNRFILEIFEFYKKNFNLVKILKQRTTLTPQQELGLITPQQESAPRRPISKFSYQKFEKVKIFNSRIWKIYVQGTHITKYLGICHASREWQYFQIQIDPVVADSC